MRHCGLVGTQVITLPTASAWETSYYAPVGWTERTGHRTDGFPKVCERVRCISVMSGGSEARRARESVGFEAGFVGR